MNLRVLDYVRVGRWCEGLARLAPAKIENQHDLSQNLHTELSPAALLYEIFKHHLLLHNLTWVGDTRGPGRAVSYYVTCERFRSH